MGLAAERFSGGELISVLNSMNDRGFLKLLKVLMVCCVLVFVGGVVTFAVFYQRHDSRSWPTATGVVTTSALKLDFHKPGHPAYYRAFVCYSYEVGGIPRGSTTVTFADAVPTFPKEEGLKWLAGKYPIGKQVPVFYDPADPDLAVLEPGAEDLGLMAYYMIGLGISAAVGVWVLHQRAKERLAKAEAPPVMSGNRLA